MVLGLLVTSVAAGTIVGRTGRYKIFPIVGSLMMAVGLFLLSRHGRGTHYWSRPWRCSCWASASGCPCRC